MNLITWLFGIGSAIATTGIGFYLASYKSLGLWLGFGGIVVILLAVAIQWQQAISTGEMGEPYVFVKSMGISSSSYIGSIPDKSIHQIQTLMPTLVGQPVVYVSVQSVDHSAFDIDMAAGFLITAALPTERPPIKPPDRATPGAVLARGEMMLFNATCPFVISTEQMESLARKREFFIVFGWIKYKDSPRATRSHETGFAGIWDVSKSAFDLPKQTGYNYQK